VCAILFRWTRDNCEIVPFTPQSPGMASRGSHDVSGSGGLNEEVLSKYRTPTSVDDVVQQRTLTVQMNHNNYVHRMHDLLHLEEFTQAKLIAELVQLLVSAVADHFKHVTWTECERFVCSLTYASLTTIFPVLIKK